MADGGSPAKHNARVLPKGWPRPTASLNRTIQRKTGLSGKLQWVLVGLALGGVGLGYAIGVLTTTHQYAVKRAQQSAAVHKVAVPPAKTTTGTAKAAPEKTAATPTPASKPADPIAKKLRAIMPQIADAGAPKGPTGKPLAYEEPLPHGIAIDKLRQVPPKTTTPAPAPAPDAASIPPSELPPWRRYALKVPPIGDQPVVAIVMDDLGVDRRRTDKVEELPGPLTLSYMTYAHDVQKQVARGRSYGHEIMMHVPMEPTSTAVDPGPHVLLTEMPASEIKTTLDWDLARFHGYTGINNHMGSKFTSDSAALGVVMRVLKKRGLLFLDSLTSPHSHGAELARADGVPYAVRNVFLDDSLVPAEIRHQLAETVKIAKETGSAIAIGHPHDSTIAVLKPWLEGLKKQGIRLVPLSALIKNRFLPQPTAKATEPQKTAPASTPAASSAPAATTPASPTPATAQPIKAATPATDGAS